MNILDNGKELLEIEILKHLLDTKNGKNYFGTVFPTLEKKYFSKYSIVFDKIKNFYNDYKKQPNIKELIIYSKDSNINDVKQIKEFVKEYKSLYTNNENDEQIIQEDILISLTEKFLRKKIFEEAIITGAEAIGKNKEEEFNKAYNIAEKAIKLSLNDDLGVMYDEIEKVYEEMQIKQGLLTGIKSFDKMIYPGYQPKTLHSIMAPSGVGKTAALVSLGVQFVKQNKDVVMITLEMSEAEYYKRIYSNLLDIDVSVIPEIDKVLFKTKLKQLKLNENKDKLSLGNLIVKEFPTGSLTPLKLDAYLEKLKIEKNIKNPVVMIDYLGLMASDKMKNIDNSYSYYGSIAEELRAIMQKRNLIGFSPMQLNRSAFNNIEADQSTLSESMRVYMVLDSAFLILQTPEMKEKSEMKIVFTKNRMSGKTFSFDISYDYNHFRFIDNKFNESEGRNITEKKHKIESSEDLSILDDGINDLLI